MATKPAIHGRDHCPNGSDPIPCLGTPTAVVHMYSWNYDTDPTVPNATWTSVAAFTTGKGYYGETFHYGTGMTWDFETGLIGLSDKAVYFASGWVRFEEDAQVNNEIRAVAIHRTGGSERVITTHRFDIADGVLAANRLPTHSHWLNGGFTIDLGLQVYQNSGGALTLAQAEILVRKFEPTSGGTFVINDPFA